MGTVVLSGIGQTATASERETLRGLVGVKVIIGELSELAKQFGFTKTQIQTDVELWLRQAGIKVLTEKEMFNAPGMPSLRVNLSTFSLTALDVDDVLRVYASILMVGLEQSIYLKRNNYEDTVYTWRVNPLLISAPYQE